MPKLDTDDLIRTLAASGMPGRATAATMGLSLSASLALTFALMVPTLGLRADLEAALTAPIVWFKMAFVATVFAGAAMLAYALSLPGRNPRIGAFAILASVGVMLLAAIVDLGAIPSAAWAARIKGDEWLACLIAIPLLSLPAMLATAAAMRRLAPTDLKVAGLALGLTGGGAAAVAYALHCHDDAAPFIATWYVIAIMACALIGRLAGPRLLRW